MSHVSDVMAPADAASPETALGAGGSKPTVKSAKAKLCRAHGCLVDLEAMGRPYNIKKRLCVQHMKATEVLTEGSATPMRFCQQCGKLEDLTAFEGKKRSCRTSLNKRRSQTGADDDSHIDTTRRYSEQAVHPAAIDTALFQQARGHRDVFSPACSPVSSPGSCDSYWGLAPASCEPVWADDGLLPSCSNSQSAAAAATVQPDSLMLISTDDAAAVLAEAWCEGGQHLAHPQCSSTGGSGGSRGRDWDWTDELSEAQLEALIEQELVAAGLLCAPAAAATAQQQQQQPARMAAPHFTYRAMATPLPAVVSSGSAGTVAACPAGPDAVRPDAVRPQAQAVRTQLFSQVSSRLAVLTAQFEELQQMMSDLESLRQQAVDFGQLQQQQQQQLLQRIMTGSQATTLSHVEYSAQQTML